MAATASIAMSVKDNLSAAVTGMRSSLTAMRTDATSLQQELDRLSGMKVSLKMETDKAAQQAREAKKAFLELGESATEAEREAARADWSDAEKNLENIRQQYGLVSKQVRATIRDFEEATGAIERAGNRAGTAGGGRKAGAGGGLPASEALSALGQAGLLNMAGDAVGEWANALAGSALGSELGGLFSGGLSGAVSGAAMGSLLGPVGTAAGAAIGGALGVFGGAAQSFQARDDAFKEYYGNLYDSQTAVRQESLSSGSGTAAGRENDLISFSTLFGDQETAGRYLSGLVDMANTTPFLYDDLTAMSKTLATYGYGAADILPTLRTVGDTGAALGMSTSDMNAVATALGRMKSSDKASLEYLNILNDRGVGAVSYLAQAKGMSVGDTYSAISKGTISGTEAVEIILEAMENDFSGSMSELSQTFSGLSSTVEGLRQEVDSAMGGGYNEERKSGLQAEIDAYGGALGEALSSVNQIIGENAAYMDNLKEQYEREALSAVLLGADTTVFDENDRKQLSGMRQDYSAAQADYEATGSREAALKMQELTTQARAVAQASYESSNEYKMAQDAQKDSLAALRDNTSALEAATAAYNLAQERTKGAAPGGYTINTAFDEKTGQIYYTDKYGLAVDPMLVDPGGASGLAGSHAAGLRRVPYDNYAALLHQGERVLTASEARETDGRAAPGVQVTVSGNTFGAGMDAEAVAEAIAGRILVQLEAGNRG